MQRDLPSFSVVRGSLKYRLGLDMVRKMLIIFDCRIEGCFPMDSTLGNLIEEDDVQLVGLINHLNGRSAGATRISSFRSRTLVWSPDTATLPVS